MALPKFTVVIPTRERCDVLEKALQTVTAQDYDNLEIIVCDNNSLDDTKAVVAAAGDPRVRYLNTGRRLGMSQNWEFALSHVDSDWVAIIGDDDGLMPGAIGKAAEIARATKTRLIRSNISIYSWPSLTGLEYGTLSVPLGKGIETRQSQTELSKVIRGESYYLELPALYTGGFADFSLLRELRARTGSIYRSSIPDVYAALALASLSETYTYSHEPLAVNGGSKHSNGSSFVRGENRDNASSSQKFLSEDNVPFHNDMCPQGDGAHLLSIQGIVYESFMQTADLRQGSLVMTSHGKQLELILATAGAHEVALEAWGRKFANRHRLDFDEAQRKAKSRKWALRGKLLPGKVRRALSTIAVGSPDCPLLDVFDACQVAQRLREAPPDLSKRLEYLAMRARKLIVR
jgi:glycosyltransferase involved in cell wall biosynthesis